MKGEKVPHTYFNIKSIIMTEITPKLDSMYKLTKTFENAITMVDEDWVLTDEALELMYKTEMNITQKTESIFWVLRTLEARVDMMKEEKSYINSKQNILKKNIEKLKEVIKLWLDTIPVELDKKGKKTQKIKTDRWTAFYKFSDNFQYNTEEIEDKYRVKKKKLQISDNFDLEK